MEAKVGDADGKKELQSRPIEDGYRRNAETKKK